VTREHGVVHEHGVVATVKAEGAGVLARAVGLWALWLAALAGSGLLVTGPLQGVWPLTTEDEITSGLAAARTPAMDDITRWWSIVGNTEVIILSCAVAVVVVRLAVGRWREPLFLVGAVSGQALVFVLTTLLVDRERPDVEKLDPAPPTSSFPSGHVGATTALYVGCALVVLHTVRRHWVRVVVPLLCLLPVVLVGYGRLYRGMHHPSDVALGLVNGLVCVAIAWWVLLRDHPYDPEAGGAAALGEQPRPVGSGR
jgi:membrane-associated phospholipid phosphatase